MTLTARYVLGTGFRSQFSQRLEARHGERLNRFRTGSGSGRWALDRAVDKVRARFGRHAVGYAAVVLNDRDGVPDEFRELAETTPGDPAETS